MLKRMLPVAPLAALIATAAIAQDNAAAPAAANTPLPRAVAAEARQLAAKEAQLAELNQQLERARREMEAAAREISRLSVTQQGGFFIRDAAGPVVIARGRIGANIARARDGALVVAVTPGGPADEAGILSGDIITAVDGEPIAGGDESVGSVMAVLAGVEPGATVPVAVTRAGEAMSFDVETGEAALFGGLVRTLPGAGGPQIRLNVAGPRPGDLPDVPAITRDVNRFFAVSNLFAARWRDMELVALSPELGSYFGSDTGLLVVRAPTEGGLDLHDGDVILEIGDRTPTSPEHAMRILASFAPGETLEMRVLRHERRETISYTLPEPGEGGD